MPISRLRWIRRARIETPDFWSAVRRCWLRWVSRVCRLRRLPPEPKASYRASMKAVFLDRDGVINQTVIRRGAQRAPQDLSEWAWIEGVHETLQALSARGYLLFVCTNQPDVVRGWQTREQVDAFHALIERELPVARIYACFHDNHADCVCRKPRPGMLLQAQQ